MRRTGNSSSRTSTTTKTSSVSAPSIKSISPDTNVIGDGLTDANVLQLAGSAAANSTIKIYDGGALIGTVVANSSGVWSYTSSVLRDGQHNFSATSTLSGTTSTSSSVKSITVDTVAPGAPKITDDHLTGTNQVTLSGTAEANSKLIIYDGDVQLGSTTVASNGSWTYTSGALSNGTQKFTVTAMDAAGNVSVASQSVSLTVGAPTTDSSIKAPAQAAVQSFGHLVFDDEFNSTSSIDMSNSHAAGYDWYLQNWFSTGATNANNVTISNGALMLGGGTGQAALVSAFANSSGGYTGTVFGNGAYMEASIKFDPSAGGSAWSWPAFWGLSIEHIIDPGATSASKAAGQAAGYSHYAEVDIMEYMNGLSTGQYLGTIHDWSGTYSTADGWQINIANYGNSFINVGSVDWSAYHSYGLSWVPQSGNTPGHATWYFDGKAMSSVYWLAPTTTIAALAGSDSGSLTPSASGSATSTYSILDSQQLALSLQTDSSWPMYVDWVRVWQSDSSSVKLAAPVITSFSDSGVVGDGITNVKAVVLTGTAAANSVEMIYDGTTWLGTAAADSNGVWKFATADLADGTHHFIATATDSAGNSSTGSTALSVTVDTVAPTVSLYNESFSGGKLTLTGASSGSGDKISIYDGSTLLGTTTTGSDGTWSLASTNVSSSIHTYTVKATDAAGNVGSSTDHAILGTSGANSLVGTSGFDIIVGNGGNDTFLGGAGGDLMYAGSGKDTFVFKAVSESTPGDWAAIIGFDHVNDVIKFSGISGINGTNGIALFQGQLSGSGNLTLNAHSVAYIETGGNTHVLVNTTNAAQTVTAQDTHAANMEIALTGTHLGLTSSDFLLA